jgi:methionine synthase I (cobalamin-dependent)
LLAAPEVVRQVLRDDISAGARGLASSTDGVIRRDLAKTGMEEHVAELSILASNLASEARSVADCPVLTVGSLPPLHDNFRPALVSTGNETGPPYIEAGTRLEFCVA